MLLSAVGSCFLGSSASSYVSPMPGVRSRALSACLRPLWLTWCDSKLRETHAPIRIELIDWHFHKTPRRRAKPGRFGILAFALKDRHFGGECSQILAGKARKCGRFWVFACVSNPGKQSIWRQFPPSARKQSTKKTAKSSRFYPCTPPAPAYA